jgi:hypothetical protein
MQSLTQETSIKRPYSVKRRNGSLKGGGVKGKNLRLLDREESPNRQPSIQEIIGDLKEEIAQGKAVYTVDELRLLERKLTEYELLLRSLLEG